MKSNSMKTEERSIRSIVNDLYLHKFAIPKIQRRYVWKPKQVVELLDSIYKRFPVGSLMIWVAPSRKKVSLRSDSTAIPEFRYKNNREVYFVIDGQQRISSIFNLVSGRKVGVKRGGQTNFSHFYFDFRGAQEERFIYRKRDPGAGFISVPDALGSNWRRLAETKNARMLRRIKEFREAFFAYKIPITKIETSDLGYVEETFIRINSGGMTISRADKVFARAADIDLRDLIEGLKSSLGEEYENFKDEILINSVAFMLGAKSSSQRDVDKVLNSFLKQSKKIEKNWKLVTKSVTKAADFLESSYGVIEHGLLPSDNIFAMVALFFFANSGKSPRGYQKRALDSWFWVTSVCQRYTGQNYTKNISADIEFMRNLAKGKRKTFGGYEKIDISDLKRTQYNRLDVRTKAFFCLLYLAKPRSFETGEILPKKAFSSSNKKDRHHIFPARYLFNRKISVKDRNSICNICFLSAEENRSIGARAPSDYLYDFTLKNRRAGLKSHLIPPDILHSDSYEDVRPFRTGYKEFLNNRARILANEFEKRARVKIFRRD